MLVPPGGVLAEMEVAHHLVPRRVVVAVDHARLQGLRRRPPLLIGEPLPPLLIRQPAHVSDFRRGGRPVLFRLLLSTGATSSACVHQPTDVGKAAALFC